MTAVGHWQALFQRIVSRFVACSSRLSSSQHSALAGLLRDQLHRCWRALAEAQSTGTPPVPSIRLKLGQDGSLATEPVIMNEAGDRLFRAAAELSCPCCPAMHAVAHPHPVPAFS